MGKLTSFSDFINGENPKYNPKPYIYVLKYIIGKEDYAEELKDYILSYHDDLSDYEDDKSFDPFMRDLKMYAEEGDIDEIENMILNYEEDADYNDYEDEDDLEEIMYNKYNFIEDNEINNYTNNNMSEDLKEFLNIDIDFEDLNDDIISEDYFVINTDSEYTEENDMDDDTKSENIYEIKNIDFEEITSDLDNKEQIDNEIKEDIKNDMEEIKIVDDIEENKKENI